MTRAINKVKVRVTINGALEYEYERTIESNEATYRLMEEIQRAVLNVPGLKGELA